MDNRKLVYAVLGIIIVTFLLLSLLVPREDLAGKAVGIVKGECASISPDPEQVPQELLGSVVVFALEPLQGVAEIISVTGNAPLGLQFYKDANVLTLNPVNGEQFTINCISANNDPKTSRYRIAIV